MLDWRITSHHPSDTLGTCIRYCSADLYNTYTMYHPPDVRWHVLNDTMSQYYLCHHRIFGLNALPMDRPAAHISIPNGPAGGTPTVLISISNGPAGCSYFNPQWTGRLPMFQSPMDQPVEHPLS